MRKKKYHFSEHPKDAQAQPVSLLLGLATTKQYVFKCNMSSAHDSTGKTFFFFFQVIN